MRGVRLDIARKLGFRMLKYLIDENLRGRLWHLIQRHNARGLNLIDVLRVGDLPELPLGSDDPTILEWCQRNGYILVTLDKDTMPKHISDLLHQGEHTPGVFMLRSDRNLIPVVHFLTLAAIASEPGEWKDWINYVP